MAIEVKAPNKWDKHLDNVDEIVFLGGVIDQGNAPAWQKRIADELSVYDSLLILNPRREAWDPTWEQSINNPQFVDQVTWELIAQEKASMIIYVFAPDAESAPVCKAPVTLLELGLYIDNEVYVVCPPGYYRKGNVDIVCERYKIRVFESVDALMPHLHNILKFKCLVGSEATASAL